MTLSKCKVWRECFWTVRGFFIVCVVILCFADHQLQSASFVVYVSYRYDHWSQVVQASTVCLVLCAQSFATFSILPAQITSSRLNCLICDVIDCQVSLIHSGLWYIRTPVTTSCCLWCSEPIWLLKSTSSIFLHSNMSFTVQQFYCCNIFFKIWDTTEFCPGWDSNSQPSDLWANLQSSCIWHHLILQFSNFSNILRPVSIPFPYQYYKLSWYYFWDTTEFCLWWDSNSQPSYLWAYLQSSCIACSHFTVQQFRFPTSIINWTGITFGSYVGVHNPPSKNPHCTSKGLIVHITSSLGYEHVNPYKYPHKPWRKIEVAICKITRLTVHFMCGLMSDLLICKLIKSMAIHDTECPYWDQVSLNNTNETKRVLLITSPFLLHNPHMPSRGYLCFSLPIKPLPCNEWTVFAVGISWQTRDLPAFSLHWNRDNRSNCILVYVKVKEVCDMYFIAQSNGLGRKERGKKLCVVVPSCALTLHIRMNDGKETVICYIWIEL